MRGDCRSRTGFHEHIKTVQDNWYGIHEQCTLCKAEIKVRKGPTGQLLDNELYVDFHEADFVQTGSQEFIDVYGKQQNKDNIENVKNIREKKHEAALWDEDLKEAKVYGKEIEEGKLKFGYGSFR